MSTKVLILIICKKKWVHKMTYFEKPYISYFHIYDKVLMGMYVNICFFSQQFKSYVNAYFEILLFCFHVVYC